MFTSKGDKEITKWTQENVNKRMEVVMVKYGDKLTGSLHFLLISLYRNASEIVHGTLYGALVHTGHPEGQEHKTAKDVFEYNDTYLGMIMMILAGSMHSLIKILAMRYKIDEIEKESDEVDKRFLKDVKHVKLWK